MSKRNSEDALDRAISRDKWLADYYVFEEEVAVSIDALRKTKFGVWRGVAIVNREKEFRNDPYMEGRSLTCAHCNTSYNTRLRKPKCPYCHRYP